MFTANCAGLEYYVTFQPPEAMSLFIMTTAMNKSEKYTIESFSAILDNDIDYGIKNQAACPFLLLAPQKWTPVRCLKIRTNQYDDAPAIAAA